MAIVLPTGTITSAIITSAIIAAALPLRLIASVATLSLPTGPVAERIGVPPFQHGTAIGFPLLWSPVARVRPVAVATICLLAISSPAIVAIAIPALALCRRGGGLLLHRRRRLNLGTLALLPLLLALLRVAHALATIADLASTFPPAGALLLLLRRCQ
ncbi:hypothetical protein HNO88_003072 [Novosphingobium chloroacetimidivorans]|uniref:Uncharacterized protein n=1 Tax=Novosphingobium chloroacetimidivorans TaxID=1428314 RepID=A0A7W7KCV7_9SPHN|nr:hypothetical protein [Novosphingobium chloroacetimidivorans]MBB4859743.1 hypothetical protein [Novosphingobium chloroacetimidivorans]